MHFVFIFSKILKHDMSLIDNNDEEQQEQDQKYTSDTVLAKA